MIDVTTKPITEREAKARGCIRLHPNTVKLIKQRDVPKGDVLEVARIAAIMAVKQTPALIPMCHPLAINSVAVSFSIDDERGDLEITVSVKAIARTGVEMEALTGTAIAALTIYDMCKPIDPEMVITDIRLLEKRGGKTTYPKPKPE